MSFQYADLTDVIFEDCNLSNVDLSFSAIHKVEMKNCKAVGINVSEATLRNVLFDNCNGKYGLFSFSDLKHVNFKDSFLCNGDFHEAKFLKVGFLNSNLQETRMTGAKLKEAGSKQL